MLRGRCRAAPGVITTRSRPLVLSSFRLFQLVSLHQKRYPLFGGRRRGGRGSEAPKEAETATMGCRLCSAAYLLARPRPARSGADSLVTNTKTTCWNVREGADDTSDTVCRHCCMATSAITPFWGIISLPMRAVKGDSQGAHRASMLLFCLSSLTASGDGR